MQIISRKQLFDLAGTSRISETDANPLDYKEFKTTWQKTRKKIKTYSNEEDDQYAITYELLKDTWLKNNKNAIKFVGEGSSRVAFALDGGKCLKIAVNEKGIAQNKQEVENSERGKFICFTQIYDYDNVNYASILTECCAETKKEDFEKLFNLTSIEIADELGQVFDPDYPSFKSIKDLTDSYKNDIENPDDFVSRERSEKLLKFWMNCLKEKGVQWDVMRNLIKFYENGGSEFLIPNDLDNTKNWGLAIRKGKPVLVILDYGFSSEVSRKYYRY